MAGVEAVFNVMAAPYNATGDGTTDDRAAINAAIAAANTAAATAGISTTGTNEGLAGNILLYFPPPTGSRYRITDSLTTLNPGVSVLQYGRIAWNGPYDRTMWQLGVDTALNQNVTYDLNVRGYAGGAANPLTNAASIGLKIVNPRYCDIRIRGCNSFTSNIQILSKMGTGGGVFGNIFRLQRTWTTAIGLHLLSDGASGAGGWITDNTIEGGVFGGDNPSGPAIGVKLEIVNGGGPFHSLRFHRPLFEISGGTMGVAFDIGAGVGRIVGRDIYSESMERLAILRGTSPAQHEFHMLRATDSQQLWANDGMFVEEPDVISDSNWSRTKTRLVDCPDMVPMSGNQSLGFRERFFFGGGIHYTGAGHALTVNKMGSDGVIRLYNDSSSSGLLTIATGTATALAGSAPTVAPQEIAELHMLKRGSAFRVRRGGRIMIGDTLVMG